MKRTTLDYLIYGNRAAAACVFFTAATILDLILCVANGIMDISYYHLGIRFFLCVLISLSLLIYRYFDKLSLLVSLIIHFFICILIMLIFTWVNSFFVELHPNAYRDAVRTIFYIYPVIIIGSLIIDGFKTAKANRILKKHLSNR